MWQVGVNPMPLFVKHIAKNLRGLVSGAGVSADAGNALTLGTDTKPMLTAPNQAAAEAGTDTTPGAWSVLRVRQAIAAWWQDASGAVGRSVVTAETQAAAREAIGAQAAGAIGPVVVSGTPTAGQVPIASGADAAAWGAPPAGSAVGSTTQLQFNDAGSFAGASGLTWDKATNTLTIAGGTLTADAPMVFSRTFNNAAVDFVGRSNDYTITASGAGTLLERWRVGGSTVVSISRSGLLVAAAATTKEVRVLNGFGTVIGFYADWTGAWLSSMSALRFSSGLAANIGVDAALSRTAAGVVEVNNGTAGQYRDLKLRSVIQAPPASITPASNGDLVFEATSNTAITLKLKGSDGTVRSVALTLA